MSTEEEIRAKALKIGRNYVEELERKSADLGLEQLRLTYKEMAGRLEDELSNFLKSSGIDAYLYTSIGEEIFNMFRDEYNRIRKEKETRI